MTTFLGASFSSYGLSMMLITELGAVLPLPTFKYISSVVSTFKAVYNFFKFSGEKKALMDSLRLRSSFSSVSFPRSI